MANNKFNAILHRATSVFLYVMVIYLPFYELVLHLLESKTSLSPSVVFWATHFYEPLVAIIILIYLAKFIILRKLPNLGRGDLYLLIFLLLAIVSVALHRGEWSRGLEGLRFLALPFVIYLIARISDYKNPKKLVLTYLWIAGLFATIGVVEYFLMPKGYFASYFGIASFGFGQNSLISTSQATAFLAGPNQLASYLLLAFFYLLHRYFSSDRHLLAEPDNYLLVIVTVAIGLTYSRSALVGLAVAALWMFIYFGKEQRKKIIYSILFIVAAVTLAVSYALMNGELLRDLLTHGSSFSQHLLATRDSFSQFIHGGVGKILFGFGVGTAGPTALKIGGIITENYYLQIIFEVGFVGFVFFGLFIAGLLTKLYSGSKTLFFAFIALLVNALFLHILADNPAMAVTIFIIVATIINIETNNVETTQITTQT